MQYNTKASTHSIYIHWPFCPYKCHFCPFVALASHDQFMTKYHNALMAEIECFSQQCENKLPLNTIYMGGGTPSTYPDDLLLDMFGRLRNEFTFNEQTEITIELNPGTVCEEQLKLWKSIGINRLSIGVQSLNDKVLQSLNRHQSAQDVFFVLGCAKKYFTNISVDIILGLPKVEVEEWKALLYKVVTWPITHISMYFLTVHEDTPLYFKVKSKKVLLPGDDTMIDLYYWSRDFLMQHGFEHYEISSFAKPGYQSRHNTTYWERVPYKAFGLGACSFDGTTRFQNEKNLMKYMQKAEKNEDVTTFSEQLTEQQIHVERVMLGLRRSKGVLWDVLLQGLPERKKQEIKEKIAQFKKRGLLAEQDNGRLVLTPAGLSVENEIIVQLS